MKADEIRDYSLTNKAMAFNEPHRVAIDSAVMLRELSAQVAELNEFRKPRWVNLSSTEAPCLIDATQVVGLSSGMKDGRTCVYVRLNGSVDPFIVFDKDHDEVRFVLGIDENWLQSPAPIMPVDWSKANAVSRIGRVLLRALRNQEKPDALDVIKAELESAIDEYEDVPF